MEVRPIFSKSYSQLWCLSMCCHATTSDLNNLTKRIKSLDSRQPFAWYDFFTVLHYFTHCLASSNESRKCKSFLYTFYVTCGGSASSEHLVVYLFGRCKANSNICKSRNMSEYVHCMASYDSVNVTNACGQSGWNAVNKTAIWHAFPFAIES